MRRLSRKNRFELVVCISQGSTVLGERVRCWLRSLPKQLLRFEREAPIIALDVRDSPVLPCEETYLLRICNTYFKRELQQENLSSAPLRTYRGKIQPISIGLSDRRLAAVPARCEEKRSDVFFAGSVYPGVRADGLQKVRALRSKGYRIDIAEQWLPLEEYMQRCARAWLVWSPAGRGWDCFRHYEAAAAGAVPVITQPSIQPFRPLEDGKHCFYYDPRGDGLTLTIENALRDPDRLSVMARAARSHVLANLTHRAICRHMLETALGRRDVRDDAHRQPDRKTRQAPPSSPPQERG